MPLDPEITVERLYIGHFTCEPDRTPPLEDFEATRFTLVANAPDLVAALDKFRVLIHEMRDSGDMLSDVSEIFLDSCSEVRAMPAKGFMSFMEIQRLGRDGSMGGISLANHGAKPPDVEGYSFGEDVKGHDEPQPSPFVTFYGVTDADRGRIALANRRLVTTKPQ